MAVIRLQRVGDGFFNTVALMASSVVETYTDWRVLRKCKKLGHEPLIPAWGDDWLCLSCGKTGRLES
jgi:hypothetical protein